MTKSNESPEDSKSDDEASLLLNIEECFAEYDRFSQLGRIRSNIAMFNIVLDGGLPRGQTVTVVGGTGAGKSELVRHLVRNLPGIGVIRVDVELGPRLLLEREVCQRAGLPPSRLKDRQALDEVAAARQATIDSHRAFWLFQPMEMLPKKKLQKMLLSALEHLRGENPEITDWVIVFDSVQRLAPGFSQNADDVRIGVQNFMYWADMFSRKADVAVVCVSEQGRKKLDPSKKKDDIASAQSSGAESRAIEYVSHALFVLYPVYDEDPETGDPAEEATRTVRIMVAKNRSGRPGWIKSHFIFRHPTWDFEVVNWDGQKMAAVDDILMRREQVLASMEPGKVYSATAIQKLVKMRYTAVKKALEELGDLECVVEVYDTTTGLPIGWSVVSPAERVKLAAKRAAEADRAALEPEEEEEP